MKSPYRRYLNDITKATPRRVPTEKQRTAIARMRAALVQTYTCQGCGMYDRSHGQSRYGVRHGYCTDCWREICHRKRQASICAWAKAYLEHGGYVVLDSETTGLQSAERVMITRSDDTAQTNVQMAAGAHKQGRDQMLIMPGTRLVRHETGASRRVYNWPMPRQ